MTQSEVSRSGSPRMADRFGPGHFRLGRLNEAAGVCGGRGTYGYSIDWETSGTVSSWPMRVASALPCIDNGGINGPGSLGGVRIDLIPKRGADLCSSVTAEMIPHFRPQEWIGLTEVEELESPVRIIGQLFYDASHVPCRNGTKASPARASVWEIHPVYALDVCAKKSLQTCPANDDTKWKPLHKWLEEQ